MTLSTLYTSEKMHCAILLAALLTGTTVTASLPYAIAPLPSNPRDPSTATPIFQMVNITAGNLTTITVNATIGDDKSTVILDPVTPPVDVAKRKPRVIVDDQRCGNMRSMYGSLDPHPLTFAYANCEDIITRRVACWYLDDEGVWNLDIVDTPCPPEERCVFRGELEDSETWCELDAALYIWLIAGTLVSMKNIRSGDPAALPTKAINLYWSPATGKPIKVANTTFTASTDGTTTELDYYSHAESGVSIIGPNQGFDMSINLIGSPGLAPPGRTFPGQILVVSLMVRASP